MAHAERNLWGKRKSSLLNMFQQGQKDCSFISCQFLNYEYFGMIISKQDKPTRESNNPGTWKHRLLFSFSFPLKLICFGFAKENKVRWQENYFGKFKAIQHSKRKFILLLNHTIQMHNASLVSLELWTNYFLILNPLLYLKKKSPCLITQLPLQVR